MRKKSRQLLSAIGIILLLVVLLVGCSAATTNTSTADPSSENAVQSSSASSSSQSAAGESSADTSSQKSVSSASEDTSKNVSNTVSAPESTAASTPEPSADSAEMQVHFLDVGEGDATLIESQGHYLLMDGGGRDHSSFVVSYLQKQGVETLDYIIASHFDEDHISGLVGALHRFNVTNVIEPGYTADTDIYQSYKSAEAAKSLTPIVPNLGDTYTLGSATLKIVGPIGYNHEDENDNSICVLVTNGANRFLFTGDAQSTAESEMTGTGLDLSADVMEAGHHGSETSNTAVLLDKVQPKFMVLSCGADNSYGHPHQSVIERIRDMGISLFRTDEQQTVTAVSDGVNITWSTTPSTTWAYGSSKPDAESVNTTSSDGQASDTGTTAAYILNTHTKKFHLPGCPSVSDIAAKNYQESNETRDQLIAEGYSPCKKCNP